MAMDEVFERNGYHWRVTAIGVGFVIGTRLDVEGEPECSSQIIKVAI